MNGKQLDRYLENSFIDDDGQRYMNHDVGMYCECPECSTRRDPLQEENPQPEQKGAQ